MSVAEITKNLKIEIATNASLITIKPNRGTPEAEVYLMPDILAVNAAITDIREFFRVNRKLEDRIVFYAAVTCGVRAIIQNYGGVQVFSKK